MYSDVIIIKPTDPYATGSKHLISCGLKIFSVKIRFNWLHLFLKVCRKLNLYSVFLARLFWGIDFKLLSKASMIIIFDISISYYFSNYLRRYLNNKRIILYYWNKIDDVKEKEIIYYRSFLDIYSYCLNDCQKYQLKHNKEFSAVPEDFHKSKIFKIQRDVFFAGKNKGRIDQIMEIKQKFDAIGISYKIICTESVELSSYGILTKPIPYEEILEEDMCSRAILDINYYNYGTTMREMEAMFLKKKLITNNIKIKERDYYNPNNVYIIDYSKSDFLEGIKDFLEKPLVPIDESILKSYSVESWIQRFIEQ